MSEQTANRQRYQVTVHEKAAEAGVLTFTFMPNGPIQERGWGEAPKRVPRFIVAARQDAGGIVFDWAGTPDDPGADREEMQKEAEERIKARVIWKERVAALVDQVEQWAREMDWSTRRVEKKLEDSWIGKHCLPALLMQADTCRVLLEPVGRSTPGTEGVVDLYLMPAYDDIASLYYYDNRWNVQYESAGGPTAAAVRCAPAVPLSKEVLREVLSEMTRHAA